jgi:dipeptidyl-peptidase 4
MPRRCFVFLAATLATLLSAGRATAQETDSSRVTLAALYSSGYFRGQWVPPTRWTPDGSGYYLLERPEGGGTDIVRVDAATGDRKTVVAARQLVPPGAGAPLSVENFDFSRDGARLLIFTNSRRVWRQNTRGDYWVLDIASGRLRKLGGPRAAPSTLMFAKFSPQGDRVAYVREHNLYVERLADGTITPLTRDGSTTIINGTFDWVYEEEFDDRDGFRWSPDGTRIAYWQLDAAGIRDFLLLNDTDSLYPFTVPVQYPQAGTANSACRVGVVSAAGGPTRWLDVPGDPRNIYVPRMEWAASSDELVFQHFNRLQDTLTVFLASARTGRSRPVLVETDSAWVDVVDDLEWLNRGARFTWVSERDGWRHVYSVSRDGRDVRLITPGAYDVDHVAQIDAADGWLYYVASPDNPTQRYLYRTRLDGSGPAERLTPANEPGYHTYSLAPGGHLAVHGYSRFGVPPVSEMIRLPDHGVARTLADNATLHHRVDLLRHGPASFFRVDADGVALDGYIMRPVDYDSTRRYPVLFFVYGEPAAQTVLDRWGGGDYLWHLMLTQQGYTVISLDNRGTPSLRGRAWRKSVYRKLGVLTSADQAAAARTIGGWAGVDSSRYGVWGWSGGGSTTLNLMFRYPDLYKVGMSVAPVADMRFYDTIYQERYMGLPQEDSEDYRLGSPVSFAEGLRGKLLIVHGTGDDNVHYKGTETLINRLVALDKPFTMMAYPNRTHGIFEGPGTTRHLRELLTRFLLDNLPAGPR